MGSAGFISSTVCGFAVLWERFVRMFGLRCAVGKTGIGLGPESMYFKGLRHLHRAVAFVACYKRCNIGTLIIRVGFWGILY